MFNPLQAIIQKHVEQFQAGIQQAMEELGQIVLEAAAGEGAVVVKINGLGEIVDVQISEAAIAERGAEELSQLVRQAVQQAIDKAREVKRQKIAEHTPLGALGVDMPEIL